MTALRGQGEKAEAFVALHAGDPFVIPNPWDAGSARVLAALGFKALATTSSGFAFTLGRRDGSLTLDEIVAHAGALARATELPVSVDLENGYGREPSEAAHLADPAGCAGRRGRRLDRGLRPLGHLYALGHATERVAAAVSAARSLGFPFLVTARAENFIRGNPDLEDTIARLQAFEGVGADVLYAPGLRDPTEIRAVCAAVSKPVNVLAIPRLSLAAIFEAGARRVSVGGDLTWVAVDALARAAAAIRDTGELSSLAVSVPLEEWFAGSNLASP